MKRLQRAKKASKKYSKKIQIKKRARQKKRRIKRLKLGVKSVLRVKSHIKETGHESPKV